MSTLNEVQRIKRAALLKSAALGVAILLAGVFIGSGATLLLTKKQAPSPRGMEFINERMINSMKEQLELTESQEKQIKLICDEHFKAFAKIREEARPMIEKEINQFNEQVKAVLDAQQRQDWERVIEQFRERFKSHRPGPGGGFGGPPSKKRGSGRERQARRPPVDGNEPVIETAVRADKYMPSEPNNI